jgi:hypothetical protein
LGAKAVTETQTGEDDFLIKRVLGMFDVPAYVRRSLNLETEERALLGRCSALRDKKLLRVRLAVIACCQTVENVNDLMEYCEATTDAAILNSLAELVPADRRYFGKHMAWRSRARRRLKQLTDECARFNEHWQQVLEALDLKPLNQMIADYNKYGLFERECAMRSARLAAHGFQPRRPWSRADLERHFPPLPVPRLRL